IDEFVGSYDDWQNLNPSAGLADETNKKAAKESKQEKPIQTTAPELIPKKEKKLSYQIKRELEVLPKEIEQLEEKIEQLQEIMAAPDFYQQDHKKVSTTTDKLQQIETALEKKYKRWEELEN
ncbi:MAG: ABC transporter ATP-binding protein, partial [Cocleimonas sp.]|nr:ABC transporter ATP-binding protein [Cocleimonas sp.]